MTSTAGNTLNSKIAEDLTFKKMVFRYLRQWKWFLLGIFISLLVAFIYLRYTTPLYQSTATIRLLSLSNNPSPEKAILGEMGLIYGGDVLHQDEVTILSSFALVKETVKELGFNFKIFSEGNIADRVLYPNPPFKASFLVSDSTYYNSGLEFEIEVLSPTEFNFTDQYDLTSRHKFGDKVQTWIGPLILTPAADSIQNLMGKNYRFVLNPLNETAASYRDRLSVISYNEQAQRSNIVVINISDRVPLKAAQFVNKLVELYNQRSRDTKNQLARATYEFINERIDIISSDLSQVDQQKERFKVGNRLTDITSEAGMFLENSAQTERELIKLETDLNTVNYMINYLRQEENNGLLPTNIGIEDQALNALTKQYNDLALEKERILRSSGEKNPIVIQLNAQLEGLKSSIIGSLQNIRSALNIGINKLKSQEELLDTKIASVPGQERENRDIQRQQNIKESIYLYLLQKREESAITLNTTTPNAEIIDPGRVNNKFPVYPKKNIVLLAALIFGMAIPFGLLFLRDQLDTHVNDKYDLSLFKGAISILGEIPSYKKEQERVDIKDQTVMGEAFRALRTNIDFILEGRNEKLVTRKIVFVTSSVKGEGKSFIAYNLAAVYAFAHKKTLLIGSDIRRPNLSRLVRQPSEKGLTEYIGGEADFEEIVRPVQDNPFLHVMQSGTIPTNPTELLIKGRTDDLFRRAREEYDVVIVDTAPCLLVSDTFLISKYADMNLYVIRANYTDKEILQFIKELKEQGKLPHLNLVLNDVSPSNYGYGKNHYGYYENRSSVLGAHRIKEFFKSLFNRAS
ncbi:GumC family protein [Robertkochia aurantiaca]|uniref:GumC family protein n=1 Tax=Robertkochia aurantiaca TaxID=2873700 RepID=UPI001CCF703A|nr:polysaccharide biosynthesis tyrosine autokinase [Robertkochia sp. 3YJGBD-33]